MMTTSQKVKIEWIKERINDMIRDYFKNGEIKEFTIEETDYGKVWIYFEIGEVGDENDLRSIYCRISGHFNIGKRGAIYYYSRYTNNDNNRKVLGKFESLLTIHCAQNHHN